MVVGPPVHFAVLYSLTGSVDEVNGVMTNTLDVTTRFGESIPAAEIASSLLLTTASLYFAFYTVRFVRRTLSDSGASSSQIPPRRRH